MKPCRETYISFKKTIVLVKSCRISFLYNSCTKLPCYKNIMYQFLSNGTWKHFCYFHTFCEVNSNGKRMSPCLRSPHRWRYLILLQLFTHILIKFSAFLVVADQSSTSAFLVTDKTKIHNDFLFFTSKKSKISELMWIIWRSDVVSAICKTCGWVEV